MPDGRTESRVRVPQRPVQSRPHAPGARPLPAPADDAGAAPDASLVEQLVARVQADIDWRVLLPGARLPSIRDFAKQCGVSRHSVVAAYDRLVARGSVTSRPGSGFYVAQHGRTELALGAPAPRRFEVAWLIRQVLEDGSDILKVGGPWLPDDWLDLKSIQSVVRALGRESGSHLLHYGHPLGYLPLRQQLQLMLSELGIAAVPEQIVLTHGTSQALELATRFLLKPGDHALADDPGYYNLYAFLRNYGVKLLGVPRTNAGPDVEALRKLAAAHRPKAYFTQTVMQNPTGTDMSPAVMYRVLQASEEFNFKIVEDDTYCDLEPVPRTRLATLDQLNRVIYVRSFSKTVSGSIRVGFAVASREVLDELCNIKVLSSITSSQLHEKIIYRLLVEGRYRRFLEQLRQKVGAARSKTLRTFQSIGMQVFAEPYGGNFVWARFPHVADSATLVARAREHGMMLAPGAVFRPNLETSPFMRFNVALCSDPRVKRMLEEFARG